jgi:general secretion pathway protein L
MSVTALIDAKVKRFSQWWLGELAKFIPASVRRAATVERRTLLTIKGAHGEHIGVEQAGSARVLAQQNLMQPDAQGQLAMIDGPELAHRWRQVLSALPRTGQVALVLPKEWTLRRTASFPLAVEENLRQVVGFELDRLTPFKAEQVYFDAVVTGRDYTEGTLSVDLAVAPKAKCDKVLAKLREANVPVAAIVPSALSHSDKATSASTNVQFNMLPTDARPKPAGAVLSVVNAALLLVLIAIGLAAVAFPIWQKRQQAILLDPLLTRAQRGAAEAVSLSEELEAKVAEHNFSINRKATQLSTSAIVSELSNILPVPNTWVQQLDIKNQAKSRTLQVQGDSTQGGKVQEIIEQSGWVQNTSIKSPIRAIPGTDRFQYNIEAEIKPLPEPPAMTDEDLFKVAQAAIEKAELAKVAGSSGASAGAGSSATPGAATATVSSSNPANPSSVPTSVATAAPTSGAGSVAGKAPAQAGSAAGSAAASTPTGGPAKGGPAAPLQTTQPTATKAPTVQPKVVNPPAASMSAPPQTSPTPAPQVPPSNPKAQ